MAKKSNFLRTVQNVVRTRLTRKIFLDAEESFAEAVAVFYQDLDSHPITTELENHTSPSEILRTKGGWKRTGTLFGFMGFSSGSNPIGELKSLFRDPKSGLRLELNKSFVKRVARGIVGTFIGPSEEDLQKAGITLDRWGDGRSWPEVLESSGIENLPYFLSKEGYGRSQEGSQIKVALNPGSRLSSMPYLSPIFRKVESLFNKTLQTKAKTRRR